jgi:hypothetical protein
MKAVLRVLVTLTAVLFVVLGLRWAVDPGAAAATLGMPLLDGVGRATQIGDIGGLFLTLGIMMLLALVTARRTWFYAPALLLLLIALLRLLAWLLHGAALTPDAMAVELVVAGILLFAAPRLAQDR